MQGIIKGWRYATANPFFIGIYNKVIMPEHMSRPILPEELFD